MNNLAEDLYNDNESSKDKTSCEYWINERNQIKHAFDQYIAATEGRAATMTTNLMLANARNDSLRQKAKAGWATAAILVVVIGFLL